MAENKTLSFLDVVNFCNNIQIGRPAHSPSTFDSEKLVPFYLSPSSHIKLGLLRPIIIETLLDENRRSQKSGSKEVWFIKTESPSVVAFNNWIDTPAKRTAVMKEICERWRDTGMFSDICGPTKWRAEMYPIYANPFGPHDYPSGRDEPELNYVFELERTACALFGLVTYGVHLSIYKETKTEKGTQSLQIWTPTRSKTKQTWPGYLDNTVAGGIPAGMGMLDSMIKECMEEASLPKDVVLQHIRAAGVITYFFRTSQGWLQPEVEYVYDMRLPDSSNLEPRPLDGEVEKFELLSQEEVISRMRQGLFKPNCAIVIIDLLIRLGIVTPDNEPNYTAITTRLHGNFDYAQW